MSAHPDYSSYTPRRTAIMKNITHILLIASLVCLAAALVMALAGITVIATPNGWLDLSLVFAVLAIAFKVARMEDSRGA